MKLKELDKTLFYTIDKCIKTYRQYAAKNIRNAPGSEDITIDQWLVLKTLNDHPDLPQKDIAEKVFKDYASITRIIELLVKKGYVTRTSHPDDRRRFKLRLTPLGDQTYESLIPIVKQNRNKALAGISKQDIDKVRSVLNVMIENCLHPAELTEAFDRIKNN